MLLPAETMFYRAFPSNRDKYKGFCYRAYYPYYEKGGNENAQVKL